jgi:Protein of unknown function (DUF3662)/FHA domain
MKPLSRLESLIAEIIERPAWALSSRKLHPLELTSALTKAMERRAMRLADRVIAPDLYAVRIHANDLATLGDAVQVLEQELSEYLQRTIVERDISTNHPPAVRFHADPSVRPGRTVVEASYSPPAFAGDDPGISAARPLQGSARGASFARSQRRSAQIPAGRQGYSAGTAAALELMNSDGRLLRRVALARVPFTIGRRTDADLPLIDGKVSREHARLDRDRGSSYVVSDLQSLNGTLVNGVQIHGPRVLNDGDVLEIGHFTLRFTAAGPP